MTKAAISSVCALALGSVAATADVRVSDIPEPSVGLHPLPSVAHGRTERAGREYVRQWPGTYFETAFRGSGAVFRVGGGAAILHVVVDGQVVRTLVKPTPGDYRVSGLSAVRHELRIEVASESPKAPTRFGGFFATGQTRAAALPARSRRMEFIGDSHSVGYGNLSTRHDCTEDEVWATTDTSRGFGAMLARRYRADYEVNAISGRGMVRNYDGFAADTLPQAYPFTLFDRRMRAAQPHTHPQVIVVALGTNDFTAPLHAGERWATRAQLHADFEATYVRFVRILRARDPDALIVLWATDMADGEIAAEVQKVAATLRAAGERRIAYVPVDSLSLSACHAHPSLSDQQVIAGKLAAAIDARPDIWMR